MSAAGRWVFLRGLTRDARHWGEFIGQFQRRFPQAEIVPVDFPGNGSLNAAASPTSVEAMAGYCREELARRRLLPPFHVLAMSLGAMVAVAWAHRHPEDFCDCVLINTSMRPYSPFNQRLRSANYATLLRLALGRPDARAWEEAILRMTSNRQPQTRSRLDDWIRWRQTNPVSPANALRQLQAAARFRAPSKPPLKRLLVLASAGDRLVDVRCSRRLVQAWGCDYAEHKDAGHDLPLDDGEWVAARVEDWIASIDPASA